MTASSCQQLKRAVIARLDSVADEHHLRHQGARVNRYSMRSDHGAPIELMFEKGPKDLPHLWVLAAHAAAIPDGAINSTHYSKDKLYKTRGKNGKLNYGRHGALEKMPQLGLTDLRRFTLATVADLDLILDALRGVQNVQARAV